MAEFGETELIQLKKAIASHPDLSTLQTEGGDSNIGHLVELFLKQVHEKGVPEGFAWPEVRAVILNKFHEVAKQFEAEQPIASLPPTPNVDNYTFQEYCDRITACLNNFTEASPFTLGRMCELLLEPRKHYDRGDKFLRAFEKCVTVTSTNGDANGNGTNGHHENGTNGHHEETTNGSTEPTNGHSTNGTNGHSSENGAKQEEAVSSTIDGSHENGTTETAPTTETTPEDVTGVKRPTEEPGSAPKKAKVEGESVAEGETTSEPMETAAKPEETPVTDTNIGTAV